MIQNEAAVEKIRLHLLILSQYGILMFGIRSFCYPKIVFFKKSLKFFIKIKSKIQISKNSSNPSRTKIVETTFASHNCVRILQIAMDSSPEILRDSIISQQEDLADQYLELEKAQGEIFFPCFWYCLVHFESCWRF